MQRKFLGIMTVLALTLVWVPTQVGAAALTDLVDEMSRLATDTASDHEIQFVTPTGVASTEDIVITFPSDFDGTGLDEGDVDMFIQDTPIGACDGTGQTLVAAAPGTDEWTAVFSGTENRVLTITSGGATAIAGAGDEICVQIGQNATGGAGNTQYVNPSTTGTKIIDITAGDAVDTGDISVEILGDDQVAVTAEVGQTITFSIGDNAVGFGTLSSGSATWANAGATGAGSETEAHTITVGTNAANGYTVTYNGATLTSGSNTIDVATITNGSLGGTEDGVTEQFAMSVTTDGDATIATDYDNAANDGNYSFVASTTTTIASETSASANEELGLYYLANIATLTEAGSYSTAITYTGTANF